MKAYQQEFSDYDQLNNEGRIKHLEIGNKSELSNSAGTNPLFLPKKIAQTYVTVDDNWLFLNPDYFSCKYDEGDFSRKMIQHCFDLHGEIAATIKRVQPADIKNMGNFYTLNSKGSIEFE